MTLKALKTFLLCLLSVSFTAACSCLPHRMGTVPTTTKEGLPHAQAIVNGEARELALDTGAVVMVLREAPKNIDPKDIKAGQEFQEFSGTVKTDGSFKADLKLGNLPDQRIDTVLSKNHRHDVLPLAAIASDKMIFDFPNNRVIVGSEANFCKPENKFRYVKDLILVSGRVYGHKIKLIWDTGAQVSILDDKWAQAKGVELSKSPDIELGSLSSKNKIVANKVFVTADFFNVQTDPLGFIVMPFNEALSTTLTDVHGILGYHFIKNYRWYFDFNKKSYCFAR